MRMLSLCIDLPHAFGDGFCAMLTILRVNQLRHYNRNVVIRIQPQLVIIADLVTRVLEVFMDAVRAAKSVA